MVKAPTPEEEDRRRLCRERKVLTAERVRHVNRVKGLLFSQGITGYEPLRRDRRERLGKVPTRDNRPLPGDLRGHGCPVLDLRAHLVARVSAREGPSGAVPFP